MIRVWPHVAPCLAWLGTPAYVDVVMLSPGDDKVIALSLAEAGPRQAKEELQASSLAFDGGTWLRAGRLPGIPQRQAAHPPCPPPCQGHRPCTRREEEASCPPYALWPDRANAVQRGATKARAGATHSAGRLSWVLTGGQQATRWIGLGPLGGLTLRTLSAAMLGISATPCWSSSKTRRGTSLLLGRLWLAVGRIFYHSDSWCVR